MNRYIRPGLPRPYSTPRRIWQLTWRPAPSRWGLLQVFLPAVLAALLIAAGAQVAWPPIGG